MSPTEPRRDIAALFRKGEVIDEALQEAFRLAIECHRRAGVPLVFWRNGRVEEVHPEAIGANATARRSA